jgi:hypothetical protein
MNLIGHASSHITGENRDYHQLSQNATGTPPVFPNHSLFAIAESTSPGSGNRVLVRVINASGKNTRIFGFGTENNTELNMDCSRQGGF